MMALVSKTRILMEEAGQDSFTADEMGELMAKAVSICIADIKEASNKREEKGNASTDKEQRDGE
jgi:hypothetical protein